MTLLEVMQEYQRLLKEEDRRSAQVFLYDNVAPNVATEVIPEIENTFTDDGDPIGDDDDKTFIFPLIKHWDRYF